MEGHFEIYPEHVRDTDPTGPDVLTGEYCWRYRASNGAIVATGGESFTTEEHANRSIHEFVQDVLGQQPHPPIEAKAS